MALKSKVYSGNMILCEYNSSNLTNSTYDTVNNVLIITFKNGQQYKYFDVPHEIFAELNIAESQGKSLNNNINKNFKYEKI